MLAVFIFGILYASSTGLFSYFEARRITTWLERAGALAPIAYIFIMALAIVISPIPSVPLDLAAGAFFGPLPGTAYSLVGALVGAVICFVIARYLGRQAMERLVHGHINFCTECSDRLLTKLVFFSRLVPFISFDVVSYGAGLTGMSLKKFSLATFFGMIPLTFIFNYSGSVLVVKKELALVAGFLMVALFFLIPLAVEKTKLLSRIVNRSHRRDIGASGHKKV